MITIKEARSILKEQGRNLKDSELQTVLVFLQRLGEKTIDNELSNNIASHCSKSYN